MSHARFGVRMPHPDSDSDSAQPEPRSADHLDNDGPLVDSQACSPANSSAENPLPHPPPETTVPSDVRQPVLRQLILPTDRRNPSFTLYRLLDKNGLKCIQVYYGLEQMEVVADDPFHPTFRSMIARLYNTGIKLKSLVEVFGVSPKTIRSWGAALLSRDPKRMSVMFFGADAARKRTVEIEAFVRMRLPELLAKGVRNYRVKLQEEIELIFQVRLSGETLRILMAGLKLCNDPSTAAPAAPESPPEAIEGTAAVSYTHLTLPTKP
jgi:hypothetical protein